MSRPVLAMLIFIIFGGSFLKIIDHLEAFPTYMVSCVALTFSFYAYNFTQERFRLDLFEKRWDIYEKVLQFCSVVIEHGGLPKHDDDKEKSKRIVEGLQAAHESFRGIGYHKTRAFFGPEIHKKFEELNEMYAWFVTQPKTEGWAEKESKYLKSILSTINELPDIFKPYMYFGDFKKTE